MPIPTVCDWGVAKDLYCNGLTAKEVAEQLGINVQTLQKRATKEKWGNDRVLTRQGGRLIAPNSLSELLNAEMGKWVRGAVRLTQRITDLANKTPVKPDLKQLRDATAILESIVKSGRAMFGLDKAQAEQPKLFAASIRVGVTVDNAPGMEHRPTACAVIDVDSQQDATPCDMTAKQSVLTEAGQVTDPLPEPSTADATGGDPFPLPHNDIPPTQ
jgi:hypothetical protein